MTDLATTIDAMLPQMQCGRCGYKTCRPYAEALSQGNEDISKCTPGGASLVSQLADLLGRPSPNQPEPATTPALQVAVIVEQECIGCTKCLQVCPVAAILGAAKQMHTVLVDLCSGCELCLPVCPVDCIELTPASFVWDEFRARGAKQRYTAWTERNAKRASMRNAGAADDAVPDNRAELREEIAAAVARRRART